MPVLNRRWSRLHSRESNGWRQVHRASGPSANALAAPNSRTYPKTIFVSCVTIWQEEIAVRAIG